MTGTAFDTRYLLLPRGMFSAEFDKGVAHALLVTQMAYQEEPLPQGLAVTAATSFQSCAGSSRPLLHPCPTPSRGTDHW
jgi:hypothetical protein